uniref:Uncharacterized protein n=1 Tax=Oryza nivara TaxID=4536 RepID=A0A0E0JAC5_ORYNI
MEGGHLMGFRGPSHARRAEAVFPLVGPALMGRDPFFSFKSSPRRRPPLAPPPPHAAASSSATATAPRGGGRRRRWSGSAAGRSSWRTAPCPMLSAPGSSQLLVLLLLFLWG